MKYNFKIVKFIQLIKISKQKKNFIKNRKEINKEELNKQNKGKIK